MGQGLAVCNILLSIGASLGYGFAGDWRHCIYWGAAAVLTTTVTVE